MPTPLAPIHQGVATASALGVNDFKLWLVNGESRSWAGTLDPSRALA